MRRLLAFLDGIPVALSGTTRRDATSSAATGETQDPEGRERGFGNETCSADQAGHPGPRRAGIRHVPGCAPRCRVERGTDGTGPEAALAGERGRDAGAPHGLRRSPGAAEQARWDPDSAH